MSRKSSSSYYSQFSIEQDEEVIIWSDLECEYVNLTEESFDAFTVIQICDPYSLGLHFIASLSTQLSLRQLWTNYSLYFLSLYIFIIITIWKPFIQIRFKLKGFHMIIMIEIYSDVLLSFIILLSVHHDQSPTPITSLVHYISFYHILLLSYIIIIIDVCRQEIYDTHARSQSRYNQINFLCNFSTYLHSWMHLWRH